MRISQREARRLRKANTELLREREEMLHAFASEWPQGIHIGAVDLDAAVRAAIHTARKLGHGVAVTLNSGVAQFYAIRVSKDN